MHRIGEPNVVWPAQANVAQIMKRSTRSPISITAVFAVGAPTMAMITTTLKDLRFRKIFDGCDAFGSILNVSTWSHHDDAFLGNGPNCTVGRESYSK